jgi:hypothetical protein
LVGVSSAGVTFFFEDDVGNPDVGRDLSQRKGRRKEGKGKGEGGREKEGRREEEGRKSKDEKGCQRDYSSYGWAKWWMKEKEG